MDKSKSESQQLSLEVFSDFVEQLYFFSRVFQKYEAIPRNYNTETDLYMKEMHTLQKVYDKEGITVSEIATIEHVTQSAVSQKVNKLEKKGFIEKKRDPNEYKKINLFTTDKGKIACQFHKELDRDIYTALMDRLPLGDYPENETLIKKFTEILEDMAGGMQNHIKEYKKSL